MRSVGRCLALLAGLVWVFAGSDQGALAQSEDANTMRARDLFRRGVDAYDRGVYFEALQAFQEAYQLRPHPAVRVNIANCFDKLDRPAEAIKHLEQFLGSGAGSPEQQKEVMQALERLRKRVGRLVLRVTPDGARIVIDNGDELKAPVTEPVYLKAGRHQVNIALDAHETALRVVDIQAEGTTELTVALARLDVPPPIPPSPGPPPVAAMPPPSQLPPIAAGPSAPSLAPAAPAEAVTHRGLPATVWLAGSVTLAALLSSIITGQLALAADREFNGELAAVRNMALSNVQRAEAWSDGINSADRAHTFAVATDVLLSTAVVGAVLTTVLYLNHHSSSETPPPAAATRGLQLQF